MSFSFFMLLFLATIASLLPLASPSCPPQKYTCGRRTLNIEFPFFTDEFSDQCSGLHRIQCMNRVPTVHFKGINYVYPVTSISYSEETIIIHDISLSAYFRASYCIFLYEFQRPVSGFAFNSLSVSLHSAESFFDCRQDYDFDSDIFRRNDNLSLCGSYGLYYSGDYGRSKTAEFPDYCKNYSDLGFHWKLSFGGNHGGGVMALMAAGFSPEWTNHLDCFSCDFGASSNCSGVEGDSSCRCSANCKGKKNDEGVIIGASIAVVVLFLFLSILCFICFRHYIRQEQKRRSSPSSILLYRRSFTASIPLSDQPSDLTGDPCLTHIFSYDELHDATNSFDTAMEIGDGGFGAVYKGTLRDGRIVAVKRLYESNLRRAEQFANEVAILSRLRHQNLVSLYGCTSPRCRELLLVYEFVPNGTVADHLHGNRATEGRLTWPRRLSVAMETAGALAYLHAVDPPIVHRDVKTVNILLDAEFHVRIADFGLSRLFPRGGATLIATAPQGTPGYLDPEYHRSYQLTDRSDVYSFGVVLAELLSSTPAVDVGRDRSEINLAALAVNRIQNGDLEGLLDRKLGYDSNGETRREMSVVAELAFRCLQEDGDMRPAIMEVSEVLMGLQKGGYDKLEHFVQQVAVEEAVVGERSEELPGSPDTVTEKWVSRSTTPDASQ